MPDYDIHENLHLIYPNTGECERCYSEVHFDFALTMKEAARLEDILNGVLQTNYFQNGECSPVLETETRELLERVFRFQHGRIERENEVYGESRTQ